MTVNGLIAKIKLILRQLRGALPSRLPQGMAEFNDFVNDIRATYNPPGDLRTARFIVATLIMRLGPTEAFKSKLYFALSMMRGASSQVSVYVMEQIKQEQSEEREQEKAAQQQSEATLLSPDASNVKPV